MLVLDEAKVGKMMVVVAEGNYGVWVMARIDRITLDVMPYRGSLATTGITTVVSESFEVVIIDCLENVS